MTSDDFDSIFPVTENQFERFATQRVSSRLIRPNLVSPDSVLAPQAYERLRDSGQKEHFRRELLDRLTAAFRSTFGHRESQGLLDGLLALIDRLAIYGVAAFADVVDNARFRTLDAQYTEIMERFASSCMLHDYVNLRNLPAFLADSAINWPFLHPLFILLISYRIGAPVVLVDARAKDAGPISAQAQDNMLHIDDVPFRDEYKVFVCWQKGTCDGPTGQNFVYLPGTNRLARDCYLTAEGIAYSTENASVFVTAEAVDHLFDCQKRLLGSTVPIAVEVTNSRPTTIVFQAGALVHQRYRTLDGNSRSAIFVAFQGVTAANTYRTAQVDSASATELTQFVLGYLDSSRADTFLRALMVEARQIGEAIQQVTTRENPTAQFPIGLVSDPRPMEPERFERWRASLTGAPKIEDLKLEQLQLRTFAEAAPMMPTLMSFDKHGQLDLPLYEDGREKIRKWARNRIGRAYFTTTCQRPAGYSRCWSWLR